MDTETTNLWACARRALGPLLWRCLGRLPGLFPREGGMLARARAWTYSNARAVLCSRHVQKRQHSLPKVGPV